MFDSSSQSTPLPSEYSTNIGIRLKFDMKNFKQFRKAVRKKITNELIFYGYDVKNAKMSHSGKYFVYKCKGESFRTEKFYIQYKTKRTYGIGPKHYIIDDTIDLC